MSRLAFSHAVPAAAVNQRVVVSLHASLHVVASKLAIPVVLRRVAAVADFSVACDTACIVAVRRLAVSRHAVASKLVSRLAVASLLVSPLVVVSPPVAQTLAAIQAAVVIGSAVVCSRVCIVGAHHVAAATPAVSRLAVASQLVVASPPADATEHHLESSLQTAQ